MTAPGDRLMSRFDVVVLGAGPAGCATAIYCAQRGLRVALLETSPFPRHRPGETLHPGVEPLLHTLGVAPLDCLRHAGHWVHWDKPPRFQAFNDGEWQGFQISRSLLDGQLLSAADAAGVHILHPRRIDRVLVRQNRVQGVSADSTECKGHYVVDATGRHGWLQRQLHIPWLRFSPRLIARYGYCHDNRLHDDELGLFAHARGWHWLARISRSCLHWTQLHFVDDTRCRERPRVLDQCAAVGPVRGADVSWRRCLRTAGPGYFLVGDAAATLDPCASHGVIKALISGMHAASAIVDCLSWPAGEATVQAAYQRWLHAGFERDVAALRSFYQIHPHPPAWL